MFPNQPVRKYVYAVLAPLLAVLVYYGVVDQEAVALYLALGGAVLGVVGTETARAKVVPVNKLRDHDTTV